MAKSPNLGCFWPLLSNSGNGTGRFSHRIQPFGEAVFTLSRDHQPFLRPRHAPSPLRYAGQAL
jgi:hypothetical protein